MKELLAREIEGRGPRIIFFSSDNEDEPKPRKKKQRRERDRDASSDDSGSERSKKKEARKLMWDLKVKAIPIFNGERDTGVIIISKTLSPAVVKSWAASTIINL
jgi:hypothetical protein